MAYVGVQALARVLNVAKGTVSKRARAGSIPVAERDKNGHPLFDVEEVRRVWDNNANPMMRRRGETVAPSTEQPSLDDDGGEDEFEDDSERRLAPRHVEPEPGSLQAQLVLERRLRNRRLLGQLAGDEGLFVLKAVIDNDVMTLARQTRDGVSAQLADFAGRLYAFVSEARSEGELRIWLTEHTGKAFDEVEKALAAEKGDEFGNGNEPVESDEQPGASDADAAP